MEKRQLGRRGLRKFLRNLRMVAPELSESLIVGEDCLVMTDGTELIVRTPLGEATGDPGSVTVTGDDVRGEMPKDGLPQTIDKEMVQKMVEKAFKEMEDRKGAEETQEADGKSTKEVPETNKDLQPEERKPPEAPKPARPTELQSPQPEGRLKEEPEGKGADTDVDRVGRAAAEKEKGKKFKKEVDQLKKEFPTRKELEDSGQLADKKKLADAFAQIARLLGQ